MAAAQLKETTIDPPQAHAASRRAARGCKERYRKIGRAADGHQAGSAVRLHPGARRVRRRKGAECPKARPEEALFCERVAIHIRFAAAGGPSATRWNSRKYAFDLDQLNKNRGKNDTMGLVAAVRRPFQVELI